MAYAPAGINRRCNDCGVRHGAPNPCGTSYLGPEPPEETEATVTTDEPRCYQHGTITHHGVSAQGPGLPAHTISAAANFRLACRRCGGEMGAGDRYLCNDEGPGIMHVPPCPTAQTCDPRCVLGPNADHSEVDGNRCLDDRGHPIQFDDAARADVGTERQETGA